mgnify:CR=1 FL=1
MSRRVQLNASSYLRKIEGISSVRDDGLCALTERCIFIADDRNNVIRNLIVIRKTKRLESLLKPCFEAL